MGIPGAANPLLLHSAVADSEADGRSIRVDRGSTSYFHRTPGSAGSGTTFTLSFWWKKGHHPASTASGESTHLWMGPTTAATGGGGMIFLMHNSGWLGFVNNWPTGRGARTTRLFRDHSAWMHVHLMVQTGDSTDTERIQIWINGVRETLTGGAQWGSNQDYPTQNFDTGWNSTNQHTLGAYLPTPTYVTAYYANIHLVDGTALQPSNFTETDSTTGQLIPKEYTGSYGTNGFHLEFADNSGSTATTIGKDSSGTGNNWTPVNIQVATGGPTSVSAANGALPFYNTTDTYGATKGSGYRDEASTTIRDALVLAIPGDVLTDEHDHVNTGGTAITVTSHGDATASSAESKFYGSSAKFDGTGDYLTVTGSSSFAFGTGDFTIEFWLYLNESSPNNKDVFANPGGVQLFFVSGKLRYNHALVAGLLDTDNTITQSKWTHCALVRNSGTTRWYIDGIQNSGSYSDSKNWTQTTSWYVGSYDGSSQHSNIYLNDLRVYKGVAKYTVNFNPVMSVQNGLIARGTDSLLDHPVNGDSADSTGKGGEVSGNYATWNPLASGCTLTNGNLDASSGTNKRVTSTFSFPSGKWYWECTLTSATIQQFGLGSTATANTTGSAPGDSGHNSYIILTNGSYYHNGSQAGSGLPTLTNNDVVGIAFDADTRKLWFSKNGSWMGSGSQNPATGTSPLWTVSASYAPYAPTVGAGGADAVNCALNAGQRPFAYSAPSGFSPCSTAFLSDPAIAKPGEHFNAVLYTGNGSSKAVSGFGFDPDWVWVKRRDSTNGHNIFDQIRGATKYLSSPSTNGEGTGANELTSFDSDGFTYGSAAGGNHNGGSYVAWGWEADTATSGTWGANSKAYSRRTNATAGFSIIKFVADGSTGIPGTGAIPHGLGGKPDIVISKRLDATGNWWTGFDCLDGSFDVLKLESTSAKSDEGYDIYDADEISNWGCPDGSDQLYYVFKNIAGYSQVGTFTGQTFVDVGFKPRWLMIKDTVSTSNYWWMYDTVRDTYNPRGLYLFANVNDAEIDYKSSYPIDLLSNGFKVRNTLVGSSNAMLYIAFASAPFKYARAQ